MLTEQTRVLAETDKEGDAIRIVNLCKPFANRRAWKLAGAPAFRWGHHYTHFFYALTPHAPFRILGTSREFCLGSAQDPDDCESVQFITGMALNASAPDPQLVMSFGTNDCESRFVGVRIDRIWQMLRPMRATGSVCSTS